MEPLLQTPAEGHSAEGKAYVQPQHVAQPALEVEHVSLSFAGVRALGDVSFRVPTGSICGIIGPNGAGKSSLLNVICGLYAPESGHIRVHGSLLRRAPEQAAALGIARTFQNIALFSGLSVIENLISGQRSGRKANFLEHGLRLPRARREVAAQRERAEHALQFLQLEAYRDQKVGALSYGLRKRIELGRALCAQPKLLLLDEPMAGMNAAEKQEMAGFIAQRHAVHGTSIILIEHDVGVVLQLAKQLVVLDYGKQIAEGEPERIVRDPRVVSAYLGKLSHAHHEASP